MPAFEIRAPGSPTKPRPTNSVAEPTNASYIGWHQITQVGASLSVEIMQDQNRRIAQQVILAPELNRDLEGRLRAIKKLATNAQLPVESPSERMRKYDLTSIDAFQKTFQDLAARLVAGQCAARLVASKCAAQLVAGQCAARLVAGKCAAQLVAGKCASRLPVGEQHIWVYWPSSLARVRKSYRPQNCGDESGEMGPAGIE